MFRKKADPQFDALNALAAWRDLHLQVWHGDTLGERFRAWLQLPMAHRRLRKAGDALLADGW